MASNSRRQSRILSFQVLFEAEQHGKPTSEVLNLRLNESNLNEEARTFVTKLVDGTANSKDKIDSVLERHAAAFPLNEMAAVDRNVLSLAIYELLFDNHDSPFRVIINEAVDIAKGYGSESSGRFVNGVLASVAIEANNVS
tara:strand:- start:6093 stop:6515 length:423 start_codon:yes stop_codon:yes gene_type:complete